MSTRSSRRTGPARTRMARAASKSGSSTRRDRGERLGPEHRPLPQGRRAEVVDVATALAELARGPSGAARGRGSDWPNDWRGRVCVTGGVETDLARSRPLMIGRTPVHRDDVLDRRRALIRAGEITPRAVDARNTSTIASWPAHADRSWSGGPTRSRGDEFGARRTGELPTGRVDHGFAAMLDRDPAVLATGRMLWAQLEASSTRKLSSGVKRPSKGRAPARSGCSVPTARRPSAHRRPGRRGRDSRRHRRGTLRRASVCVAALRSELL